MKLLSVNVGRPREVDWKGKTLHDRHLQVAGRRTHCAAIFESRWRQQVDLSVMAGPTGLCMFIRAEHYDFWKAELKAGLALG